MKGAANLEDPKLVAGIIKVREAEVIAGASPAEIYRWWRVLK